MQASIDIISVNPLFEGLPQDILKDLTQTGIPKSYQAGEIFVHQGDV